jgi:hypothetical protein
MNNKYLPTILLIIAITLTIIVFIASFFLTKSPTKQINTTPPTPTLFQNKETGFILNPTPTNTPLSNKNKGRLVSQMPIKTSDYAIEHLSTSDTFMVKILKNPYQINKEKAQNWLKTHGAEDLKTLNIIYYHSRFMLIK